MDVVQKLKEFFPDKTQIIKIENMITIDPEEAIELTMKKLALGEWGYPPL